MSGKCEGTCKGQAQGGTGTGIKADGTCDGTCEGKCEVTAPGGLAGTHTAAEVAAQHHEPIGAHQALASAIQLAGKYGGVVGVIDEQDLWKEEWGDLDDEA